MNVAKSLRSGRPPRRAPHATHFASHLCPSAHFPRRRSTPTDPMPLEAADASSPLQGWQASRGLRRSRDCFGIRTTRTQLEDRSHAPWRRSLRRGRLCVGSSPSGVCGSRLVTSRYQDRNQFPQALPITPEKVVLERAACSAAAVGREKLIRTPTAARRGAWGPPRQNLWRGPGCRTRQGHNPSLRGDARGAVGARLGAFGF